MFKITYTGFVLETPKDYDYFIVRLYDSEGIEFEDEFPLDLISENELKWFGLGAYFTLTETVDDETGYVDHIFEFNKEVWTKEELEAVELEAEKYAELFNKHTVH